MVCPTTAFATWDSTDLCVVLSFIGCDKKSKKRRRAKKFIVVTHFQKVVEQVVGEVSIDIVIVIYVDNILVGSKDMESHVKELNMVIHALTKAGFKLKPLKCKITYLAIQFMGAVVDGDQRGVCPLKAEVFAKMQRPKTGKEVQKVLGFVNFLRDFIPLYSCVVLHGSPVLDMRFLLELGE